MVLTIATPESEADLDAVRALCREYRLMLLDLGPTERRIVETFYPEGKYEAMLARLGKLHSPPRGGLRLVRLSGEAVGCGMFHALAPGDAEIKRVYLSPAARGRGAGRALMEALVAQCRADGYRRILMDTGKPLRAAQALYDAMGFRRRGPYAEIPEFALPHMVFYEMALHAPQNSGS
jgi:ribosomal protein S18 acetylase RimI-like enzyme